MPRDVEPKYQVPWQEELISNVKGIFLVLRAAPVFFAFSMGVTVLQGILPAAIATGTAGFITNLGPALAQGLGSPAAVQARNAVLVIAGAIFLSQIFGPVQETARFGLQRRFHAFISRRLMVGINELPGMAYFEDPKFKDKLKVSEWIGWAPTNSINALTQMVQQLSVIAGYSFVAASFGLGWVPVVVIGAALPAGLAAVYFEAGIGLARWRHSDEMRRSDYYRDLALKLEPAKEIRIFKLKDWTLGRQDTHWFEAVKEAWAKRRRSLILRLALQAPAVAAMAYAFFYMLFAAIDGRLAAAAFAAVLMGVVGIAGAVISVFQSASWVRQSNFYLPVAFQLMSIAKKEPRLDVSGRKPARETVRSGIRFENVGFTYPGTERKILDGLDLWIPTGSSIALVGENGAGKTTMIKLLCRFYDPTDGRILIDGVDIAEFDLESLRSRLAVIFQDFVHYHLPARDNVGFGAIERLEDQNLVTEAAKRVGVLEKLEGLPQGWDTPLARDFDGVDLSGGEWQRVALARAIMAQLGRDADMLILDEPTASLDVRLEHDLYQHFAEISAGRTTLLVSHRFSTVRMAERIILVEAGKITEDGTHDELMHRGGSYSALYELQASHYRKTGALE